MEFLYTTILLLSIFPQLINCQQLYLNDTTTDCSSNPTAPKGYLCNSPQNSCNSFLVFRSKPPYDNPISIAYLFGSEASNIASINNISRDTKVPSNKTIIVPILCSCSGNIYQHDTPYTVKKDDTYFHLVNETYQSLTTCQALIGQNYYASEDIPIGAELTIPLLCACPTTEQTAKGITSLLVYTVNYHETVKSIGEVYGVDEESILEANELQKSSANILDALTPILVPLRGKSCKEDPDSFYCTCSKGRVADGSCDESDGQKFPAKLVAALGVGIGAGFLILFLLGYKLYQYIKKRRARIRKEKLFRQNGGYLLQEKLSSYGNGEMAKLFTSEEMQRSTDNYNQKLITGRKPITFNDEDEGQNMTANFISVMKDNQLSTILDDTVIKEARKEDILAIANLAVRCLRLNGKKRPTMKEVSAELEALRKVQSSLHIKDNQESPSDEQSFQHSSNGIFHESTTESFSLSSQMESTSF
ncbi:hypothetical protein P8452_60536 [Trifolium repens]|nr:hypothetical protein P8452_60536 [Trifolium repens]